MSKNKRKFTVGAMRTPKPSELKDPVLEILADGKTWRFMELVDELANRLNLTKADRERERFPKGGDRLQHYCANALAMLRDKDRLVENPARGSWKIISLTAPQKKQLHRPSKSHNSALMLNLISTDLINDKKTKIRNPSRKKSYYGKKIARRRIPQRKKYAMEPARVREAKAVEPAQEAKPIENITPTETKIPWRSPRSKPDPGIYACRTILSGIMALFFILCGIIFSSTEPVIGSFFLLIIILLVIGFIFNLRNSRGGW